MDLESLYLLVTEAIMRAEALQDLNAPGAPAAFVDLSLIEEEIAKLLPPSDPEGAIARRGAVRAAALSGDMERASGLVNLFVNEDSTGEALRGQLLELLGTAPRPQSENPASANSSPAAAADFPAQGQMPAGPGRPTGVVVRPVPEPGPSAPDDSGLRRWVEDLQRVAAGLPALDDGPDVPARTQGGLRVFVRRETIAEVLSRSA